MAKVGLGGCLRGSISGKAAERNMSGHRRNVYLMNWLLFRYSLADEKPTQLNSGLKIQAPHFSEVFSLGIEIERKSTVSKASIVNHELKGLCETLQAKISFRRRKEITGDLPKSHVFVDFTGREFARDPRDKVSSAKGLGR